MTNDLTIPYTREELTNLVATYAPDHIGLSVKLARQLLSTMQREEQLREALEMLISCAKASATVHRSGELMHDCDRARKALNQK